MRAVTVHDEGHGFRQTATVGPHEFVCDVPVDAGGEDAGPTPEETLLTSLGACTSMTLSMFARRKAWPLTRVVVTLSSTREGDTLVIQRDIELTGELDDEMRARLLSVANKCPVHKILTTSARIESKLV